MARRKNRDDRGPDAAAMRAAREGRPPAPGGVYAMTISALARTLAALFELKACHRPGPAREHWRTMAGESMEATIGLFGILTEDHLLCAPEFEPFAEAIRLLNEELERLMDDNLRELLTTDRRFNEIIDNLKGDNDDQR